MKTGIELIAEERQRQIDVEKWDTNHDSAYKNGELVGAAMCYAANSVNKDFTKGKPKLRAQVFVPADNFFSSNGRKNNKWEEAFPWDSIYDKRDKHDKIRSLQIAGALIAAEIDRLNSNTEKV